MSGQNQASFVSVSLRRVPAITPSPVVCRYYEGETGNADGGGLTAADRESVLRIMDITGCAREAALEMYLLCEKNIESAVSVILGL